MAAKDKRYLNGVDHINRPKGYKTFSMLNSAEHEIIPANKKQITRVSTLVFLLRVAEYEIFSAYK